MQTGTVHFGGRLYFPLQTPALVRQALSRECSQALMKTVAAVHLPLEARVYTPLATANRDIFRRTFKPGGDHSQTEVSTLGFEVSVSDDSIEVNREVFQRLIPVLRQNDGSEGMHRWPKTFEQIPVSKASDAIAFNRVNYIPNTIPGKDSSKVFVGVSG